jgi:hypothetical protein
VFPVDDPVTVITDVEIDSADALAGFIKGRVDAYALGAEEDINPTAFLGHNGDLAVLELGMFLSEDDEPGRYLARTFELLKPGALDLGGTLSTAWQVVLKDGDPRREQAEKGELMPADMLDIRREIVMVHTADKKAERLDRAYIVRDGDRPVVAEWETQEPEEIGGRIASAVKEAVRGSS